MAFAHIVVKAPVGCEAPAIIQRDARARVALPLAVSDGDFAKLLGLAVGYSQPRARHIAWC